MCEAEKFIAAKGNMCVPPTQNQYFIELQTTNAPWHRLCSYTSLNTLINLLYNRFCSAKRNDGVIVHHFLQIINFKYRIADEIKSKARITAHQLQSLFFLYDFHFSSFPIKILILYHQLLILRHVRLRNTHALEVAVQ